MITTHETPTPDYGAPWNYYIDYDMALTKNGSVCDANHAVACVNACAGMTDPVAEIQAMREAIISSYHMLKYFEGLMPNLVYLTEQQWLNTQEGKNTVSALTKLKPFLPDGPPPKP